MRKNKCFSNSRDFVSSKYDFARAEILVVVLICCDGNSRSSKDPSGVTVFVRFGLTRFVVIIAIVMRLFV